MSEEDTRKFSWSESEQRKQEFAYTEMSDIAEEHEIEIFTSGGEQFADLCEKHNIDPSDFTVEEYNEWKQWVVNEVMDAMIAIEKKAFKELVYDIGGEVKKKFDESTK